MWPRGDGTQRWDASSVLATNPTAARKHPTSAIQSRIGVSRWNAGRIREGYRPDPRHWKALVELTAATSLHTPQSRIDIMDGDLGHRWSTTLASATIQLLPKPDKKRKNVS
jgi:hypothetical protein